MLKLVRRRYLLLGAVVLSLLAGVYYANFSARDETAVPAGAHFLSDEPRAPAAAPAHTEAPDWHEKDAFVSADNCPTRIDPAPADVDTVPTFKQFDFQPNWMKSKEYWDSQFEERYKKRKAEWADLPLKVIVVPHSHTDPGWLKTFENYFHYQSRVILNNMVDKLQQYRNMTFIYTEISFFAMWWESAHPTKRKIVQSLLDEGRLEIMTGGWVMTDEATVHLYAMVDQLIEGHQWVKNNLNIAPTTGWSIDPFGHGATVPYLLKASGLNGTIIQRIHYAWKQWLAQRQMGDFIWRQNWAGDEDAMKASDMLTHNQPFDIYSIKHSCGPHPQVCLNFDFRKVPGEYTDYSVKAVPIDDKNVREKADLLLEQYGRTGSLFPHNVVLMPLGDDFRYDHDIEWDQQYINYQKLFDYINSNPTRYQNTQIGFGTPSQYFKAIQERMDQMDMQPHTLKGDFFVYSDIFSEGRPAYWSGYFTTRPYWKQLDRDLEASLRSAEILYTVALGRARMHGANRTVQLLERDFERLVRARRSLGLFQHHDAITGTSKAFVMHDYALKLFEGIQDTMTIQSRSAHALLLPPAGLDSPEKPTAKLGQILLSDTDRETYEQQPRKVPILVPHNEPRRVVIFNSLGQQRQEIVRVRLFSPDVRVLDTNGATIPCQVNPVWNASSMLQDRFEILWVADLQPLALSTYVLERIAVNTNLPTRAVVYCSDCTKKDKEGIPEASPEGPFEIRKMQAGDIQLENHKLKLLFDGRTGFLRAITKKGTGRTTQCAIQFAAYPSAQFHSGAYLFMPDPNSREPEKEVLQDDSQEIVIMSGPISSEVVVRYGKLLTIVVRVFHATGPLSEGISIDTLVDFDSPPKNRETELFMRLVTDISNGQGPDGSVPEFYTDLNGFQMQKRVKVERIGIEGNYFPVTSMTYIQDGGRRLSLLMGHSMGAASWQPGWLEVMLERRTLYDDSRGMGEGVVDNKRTTTRLWLLLEELGAASGSEAEGYSRPSLFAHHMSNALLYPSTLFVVEGGEQAGELRRRVALLSRPLPCDTHLLNLRTLADPVYAQFPAASALLLLQRQGHSCRVASHVPQCGLSADGHGRLHPGTAFAELQLRSVRETSLTGLHPGRRLPALDHLAVRPMQITAANVTFSTL
ncbi:Hypothetical predicted protein [Cloeon dipterum]|uniref:Alpha-mannosidase n=2 Tax=Cloeon dipterum TaxID=197152 RepID=A0A8S1DVV1_9INSE|nr:Hypothetical predicted protein [Cloeon dipterum]